MIKNLLRASDRNTPVIVWGIILINVKKLASYVNPTLNKVVLISVMHIAYHPNEQRAKLGKTKQFVIQIFMIKSLEILPHNPLLKIAASWNRLVMVQKGNNHLFQINQALGT